ncbi:uncharacterized protein LOC127838240 isoform X1 [Dreissena polymorpha]|uniref:Uncharacterized protein n=1 Tax=Dreissena polymorpha TaxID=45954 RepID=A0A9D4FGL0_DREPO|nr:uncharacterized protein LOC127838240 isoform X1 [Dreissena polymorpha]XP_052221818.1 uncharacterized protein LOC127838240 isoform X1 [Dreissena polymorpha]XP_052221819.1 uncharacterized protein LOC127838240 isoform X1 [Dreissena polymorpha]XP_052221820.1 uncharacterized protein LOC127838240 isoform X1 [Dreissena polymorpha]KAH3798355.1 hypothetical protein DPMN_151954 [Dreissena polymorpha]
MAFNVTYGALQSHNIKHLYTTREKTMHQKIPRQKLYRPEFLELERQANERHKNRARRRPKVNMEFVPEYNIDVARAPAFRTANKEFVDDLVARLTKKPAVKSNPRGCGHYQRGFHEYEWEEDMTSPSEPVPARRMKSILNRLTRPCGCGKRHPSPDLREDDYLPNFVI